MYYIVRVEWDLCKSMRPIQRYIDSEHVWDSDHTQKKWFLNNLFGDLKTANAVLQMVTYTYI